VSVESLLSSQRFCKLRKLNPKSLNVARLLLTIVQILTKTCGRILLVMKVPPKTLALVLFLFCLFIHGQTPNALGFQTNKTDFKELEKSLTETVKEDFEMVKNLEDKRPEANGGGEYWLVHLKPKRTGHFALKYSFKYTHQFSHPEEGENELYIRVGAKGCSRYNSNNYGLSNVCLGDTVIVPIFIRQVTGHQFSLKSTYQDGEIIGQTGHSFSPTYTSDQPINNPLEENLKYLGTERSEMTHRSCCAKTIVFTAYFEAKKAGRFNLGLVNGFGDENFAKTIKPNPFEGTPIIIIDPGAPITGLVYYENTISYSDHKRFSAHSGNNFMTNLLIIQPGDVFAIEYNRSVEDEGLEKKLPLTKKSNNPTAPKLFIQKLPFAVNKDWSQNAWLIDYLPKED
jgi:hypothetical protein